MLFTTLVGYIAGGIPGAALATFFVFLPTFVFCYRRRSLRREALGNRALQAFLADVSATVVGVIAVVSLDLIPGALNVAGIASRRRSEVTHPTILLVAVWTAKEAESAA
jgi:chromate transport protein ChrA